MTSETRVGVAEGPQRRKTFGRRLSVFVIVCLLLPVIAYLGFTFWTYHRLASEVAMIRAADEPLTWEEFTSGVATSDAGAEYAASIAELNRVYSDYESKWQWEQTEAHMAAQEALHQQTEELRERLSPTHDAVELEAAIAAEVDRLRPLPTPETDRTPPDQELLERWKNAGYDVAALSDQEIEECRRLLRMHAEAISRLKQAAMMEPCILDLRGMPSDLWRVPVHLLQLDAIVHVREGRIHDAAQTVLAMLRLRRITDGHRTMFMHLADRAITARAVGIMMQLLPKLPAGTPWLDRFDALLGEAYDPGQFTRMLIGERAKANTLMNRVLDGSGRDIDAWSLGWEGLPGPVRRYQFAAFLSDFRRIVTASKTSFPQMLAMQPVPRGVMEQMSFFHLETLPYAEARAVATIRAAHLAIEAERFRREHGRFPDDIAEITSSSNAEDLSDPFSGKPMRLRRTDTGLTIYSVGEDMRDDDGQLREVEGSRFVDDGVHLRTM